MASSFEKTLPCSEPITKQWGKDPALIQFSEELRRLLPQGGSPEFEKEQFSKAIRNPEFWRMRQRLRDYLLQNPHISPPLERDANHEASEQFAEGMAQMRKDQDLKPILAEMDARGPGAVMKFWDDKDVLKKLGKSRVTATLGDVKKDDDDLVSEGRKALEIVLGYNRVKCAKVLLHAQKKREEKRKKRASLLLEKRDASALQNMGSKTTPTDVATATSSDVVVKLL